MVFPQMTLLTKKKKSYPLSSKQKKSYHEREANTFPRNLWEWAGAHRRSFLPYSGEWKISIGNFKPKNRKKNSIGNIRATEGGQITDTFHFCDDYRLNTLKFPDHISDIITIIAGKQILPPAKTKDAPKQYNITKFHTIKPPKLEADKPRYVFPARHASWSNHSVNKIETQQRKSGHQLLQWG